MDGSRLKPSWSIKVAACHRALHLPPQGQKGEEWLCLFLGICIVLV